MINNYTLDTEFIDYSFLKMYKLPDLTKYINLKVLYCNNNELTELTNLPNTLIELNCNNNKLTKLTNLPNTLIILECCNDRLLFTAIKSIRKLDNFIKFFR